MHTGAGNGPWGNPPGRTRCRDWRRRGCRRRSRSRCRRRQCHIPEIQKIRIQRRRRHRPVHPEGKHQFPVIPVVIQNRDVGAPICPRTPSRRCVVPCRRRHCRPVESLVIDRPVVSVGRGFNIRHIHQSLRRVVRNIQGWCIAVLPVSAVKIVSAGYVIAGIQVSYTVRIPVGIVFPPRLAQVQPVVSRIQNRPG